MSRLSPEWVVESGGEPPAAVLARHLAAPSSAAAPLLIDANLEQFWLGVSHRGGASKEELSDPGCFLKGTAAFYVVGREDDPEVDFVKEVGAGAEPGLAQRLAELRWFDPADGMRHRWLNRALAERWGWLRDGRGVPAPEGYWPNPLPAAPNVLF